jgi:anthranilate synthase component 2
MRILLIDHYDSFTYTIKAYFDELGARTQVVQHDALRLTDLAHYAPDGIVLSPGPGHPREATHSLALLQHVSARYPILGICLGMQCIVEAFGGRVIHAPQAMHGKQSRMTHTGQGIFQGIPSNFSVTRYHSLMMDELLIPACLDITARTEDASRVIMGIQHKEYPVYGVQYHPEAVLTEHGHALLHNFLLHAASV